MTATADLGNAENQKVQGLVAAPATPKEGVGNGREGEGRRENSNGEGRGERVGEERG
jgi:hypothetical protein